MKDINVLTIVYKENKISSKQFEKYIDSCIKKGFNIGNKELWISFEAYNEAGYKLDLTYYESNRELSIRFEAPMEIAEVQRPNSEIAKLLPIPKSRAII